MGDVFHLHWTLLFLMIAIGQTLGQKRSIEDQTLGKADFKEVYEYDSAQADDVNKQLDFNEADWNHDGKLNFVGKQGSAKNFDEADWNRDEKLSFEEIKSYNQNFIKELFNYDDKNHDGFVDWNEAKQAPAIKFDKADWNHDGKLSFEENKSYNQNFKEMFNDVDKNLDGFIDLNEAKQATAKDFVEADWNHDGKLSFEEIKSYKHNFLKEMFNYDDKNHDGFIDWNETKQAPAIDWPEAKQASAKDFDESAWNHDGKLSFEEIKSYNQNFINEKFNDEGKNHDGFIDRNEAEQASAIDWNEAKQASAKDFDELDWNHDGKLSFEGVKSFSLNFKIEMFNDHDKNKI